LSCHLVLTSIVLWLAFIPLFYPTPTYGGYHGKSQRHFNETPSKTGPSQVKVIHPAHPLCGQEVPVLQQSAEEVLIQPPEGQPYFIPLDWTDQVSSYVCLPGACFLLEHLLTLQQQLEAIFHKNPNESTIPSQSNRQAEGDRHGTTSLVQVGPAFPGAARPGDRTLGSDHSAAMEPAGKGAS
jgi:hypothetical protein